MICANLFHKLMGSSGLGRGWRDVSTQDEGEAGLTGYRCKLGWKL